MNIKIRYVKKSKKFLEKHSHLLSESQADELLILEEMPTHNIFHHQHHP